ncbi:MAG: AMP-binding protein [Bacteroides sp.]
MILYLIYTSTTGELKGVMLTHSNLDEAMYTPQISICVSDKDVSLVFYPYPCTERAWTYFCLTVGMQQLI